MVLDVHMLQNQILAQFVADHFFWVFLALILLNVTQRKHRAKAQRKRMAVTYLAAGVLIIHTAGTLNLVYGGTDLHVVLAIVAVVSAVYILRAHAFPFTLRCRVSKRRLDLDTILYRDSNTLPEYDEAEQPEQADGSQDESAR